MTPRYAKPAIVASVPKDRHVVIEASAGTGKTFALEHLLVDYVLAGDLRIEDILVVTFTEKATAELKARVRRKLEELIAHAGTAPGVPDENCWILDDAARRRLEDALGSLDAATISTIHSFCQRVLTENAFAHRRLFGETLVDGAEAFGAAFRESLREELARDPELSEYLRAWLRSGRSVADLEGFLLQCRRLRGELRPSFDPKTVPPVWQAFAADEGLLEEAERELRGARFNASRCKAVMRRLADLGPVIQEARQTGSVAAFLQAFDAWRGSGKEDSLDYLDEALAKAPSGLDTVDRLKRLLTRLRSAVVPFAAAIAALFLPRVLARLDRRKLDAGVFDFDDMLLLVRDSLLREGSDELVDTLRQRYRRALIDEFQDTDETQWAIFRRLFFESGGKNLLCLVGDPKQSIYRFRGADIETYASARDEIGRSGGEVVTLTENFRSTSDAVEACNRIFDGRAEPPYFDGVCRYDAPVTCGNPARRASVGRDGLPAVPVVLLCTPGDGEVKAARLHDGMARAIASEARDLLDASGPGLWLADRDGTRRIGAGDVFVLTRTTAEGLRVGEALRGAGVPHAFYKQDGLFQTAEAGHVLDVLAAVVNPHDPRCRARAWITPFFGLGPADLQSVRELPASHPLVSKLSDWKALAERRDYERLWPAILDGSGIVRREIYEKESERELTNYLHLFEILLEESARARPPLAELVRRLASWCDERRSPEGENGNVQRLEGERDAVQIMTMHKSKGLEAAVVFVAGGITSSRRHDALFVRHEDGKRVAWIGRPPPAPPGRDSADEENREDRRLLYVALTRARGRVYLPWLGETPDSAPTARYRPAGCYRHVHDRVAALQSGGMLPSNLFEFRMPGPEKPAAPPPAPAQPSSLPAALLRTAADEAAHAHARNEAVHAVFERHAGFVVTSYSRLAAAEGAHMPREPERADFSEEPPEAAAPAEDGLPGGTATGVFLHEMLELLPAGEFLRGIAYDDWAARKDVSEIVQACARRHGFPSRQAKAASRMAHAGLTAAFDAGGRRIKGIGACARLLREMEFLYPIPEEAHPKLGEEAAGFSVGRGFVKGFIDVVFEEDGLAYLGDWKSDHLRDFAPASLEAHVHEHYGTQIRLYSLALARLLGLRDESDHRRRFGGIVYCFLRAMKPDASGAGVHFTRPSWSDLVGWERELVRRDYGSPLPRTAEASR